MATRPRRAVDVEMEDGPAFIVVLLARATARPANRTWTGIRLRDAGSLCCPDGHTLEPARRAIKARLRAANACSGEVGLGSPIRTCAKQKNLERAPIP